MVFQHSPHTRVLDSDPTALIHNPLYKKPPSLWITFAVALEQTRQQGLQHARRKAIYEKLHPEAKAGVAQAKGMNTALGNVADKLSATSYAADAANAVGETERTVRRKTRIGEQLAEVAEQLLTRIKV